MQRLSRPEKDFYGATATVRRWAVPLLVVHGRRLPLLPNPNEQLAVVRHHARAPAGLEE